MFSKRTMIVFRVIILLTLTALCVEGLSQAPEIPKGKERDYDYLISATQLGDVDPFFHYLLGRLYVEMDSVDAAIRHYQAMKYQYVEFSSTLRFLILRHPQGLEKFYPDFQYKTGLRKIFHSLIDISTSDFRYWWGYRFMGWGCVLDKDGNCMTFGSNYEDMSYAAIGTLAIDSIDEERRKWDSEFWLHRIVETRSKYINGDYVIIWTDTDEKFLNAPEIRREEFEPGEPVIILQKPLMKKNIICTGEVLAVRDAPMLGKAIEIQSSKALTADMALVADTAGRLVGFIVTLMDDSGKKVYAFPIRCFKRFAAGKEYSIKQFADIYDEFKQNQKEYAELAGNYDAGKLHLWQGDYTEALAVFEQIIASHPEQAQAILYKGFCHLKLNNPEQAMADFISASEMDNELAEAQYQVALLYQSQNNIEKAAEAFQKAAKMINGNPLPHYELAKYYKECGKEKKFNKELKTLMDLDEVLAEQIK
jgi:tetratricopeptide (TPR) repeat protein